MDASYSAFPPLPIPQVGVVPFRLSGTLTEFCLVTGRRSGRWGFPKGRVSEGESLWNAALCEAREEAGLVGIIHGTQLGQYGYNKRGKTFEVLMWLMQVERCDETWKESRERSRVWVRLAEARRLIDRPHLDQLLMLAANRLANPEGIHVDAGNVEAGNVEAGKLPAGKPEEVNSKLIVPAAPPPGQPEMRLTGAEPQGLSALRRQADLWPPGSIPCHRAGSPNPD